MLADGAGVVVAVLDTGVDLDHPELVGNLLTNPDTGDVIGATFVGGDGAGFWADGKGGKPGKPKPDPGSELPEDDHGHGTLVTGAIVGAASQVQIMPIKVLDDTGYGRATDIVAGIEFALDPDNDPATDDGADVINMSFSRSGFDQSVADAIASAYQSGVLVVASAGNDGESVVSYPASAAYALAVGAVDAGGVKASFSNYGSDIDVMATGVDVSSTSIGGGSGTLSGTSMAAGQAAGVAAVIQSLDGNLGDGQYRLRVLDEISTDSGGLLSGLNLDGNRDGSAGDDFVHEFTLETVPISLTTHPVWPLGSLVYEAVATERFEGPGDQDVFTIELDESLQQTISLQTTWGTVRGIPSTILLEHPELGLEAVPYDPAQPPKLTGGTLTLYVTNASSEAADYELSVLLNAMHDQGSREPQNIDSYFSTIASVDDYPSIGHDASRAAVVGRITSRITDGLAVDPMNTDNVVESFEPTAERPDPLSSYHTRGGGYKGFQLTTDIAHHGTYALDHGASSVYRDDAEAWMNRADGATISTWMRTSMPYGSWLFLFGATDSGALALDVKYWANENRRIDIRNLEGYDYSGDIGRERIGEGEAHLNRQQWYRLEVDWRPSGDIIANIYDEAGNLVTRVLAFDDTVAAGGFGFASINDWPVYFDEVRKAAAPDPDQYEFTVSAGETATVALASLTGDPVELELIDPDGNPIGSQTDADHVDAYVDGRDLLEGTYVARVIGGANAEYSLVVTRSALFDYGCESPQDLSAVPVALGAIIPEVAGGIEILDQSFEDGIINGYYQLSDAWMTLSPAAAFADGRLGLDARGSAWMYRENDPSVEVGPGDVVSVWVRPDAVAEGYASFGFGWEAIDALVIEMAYSTGQLSLQRYQRGDDPTLDTVGVDGGFVAGNWYRLEAEWTTGGEVAGRLYDGFGETPIATVTGSVTRLGAGGIAFSSSAASFDSVLVARGAAGDQIGDVPLFYESRPADAYRLDTGSEAKSVLALTPGAASGEFANPLIAGLDVVSEPDGQVVASGVGVVTVPADGAYRIDVYADNGAIGEYVLVDPPAKVIDAIAEDYADEPGLREPAVEQRTLGLFSAAPALFVANGAHSAGEAIAYAFRGERAVSMLPQTERSSALPRPARQVGDLHDGDGQSQWMHHRTVEELFGRRVRSGTKGLGHAVDETPDQERHEPGGAWRAGADHVLRDNEDWIG